MHIGLHAITITASNDLAGGQDDDRLSAFARASIDEVSRFSHITVTASNDLTGGKGDDVLSAFAHASGTEEAFAHNRLDGGSGHDQLTATIEGAGRSEFFGGTGDDELIVFGGEDNLLDGGAGSDGLRGGAGDDHLAIDLQDLTGAGGGIHGGGGEDSLLVGFNLDLTKIADDRIANVARVDMANGAPNNLTLGADDVLAMTNAGHTLFVEGDSAAETGSSADTATLAGGWAPGGTVDGFSSFTLGAATVNVDADMTAVVSAAST